MEVYYQGTDITDMVRVNSCIVRDTAGGRCDSLEIEFGNAAGWYSWGPEEDNKIICTSTRFCRKTGNSVFWRLPFRAGQEAKQTQVS